MDVQASPCLCATKCELPAMARRKAVGQQQGRNQVTVRAQENEFRETCASKRVLIVDDFPQHLLIMGKALRNIGFSHIEFAKSCQEALSQCAKHSFDIVFSDYNLGPGKNGAQLLKEMQEERLLKRHAICVLATAETSREVVLGALESEPEAYIVKPFSEGTLQRKIERLLEKQSVLGKIHDAIADGDFKQAISWCFKTAEKNRRYSSWCLRTAAELYLKIGKTSRAQEVYNRVLQQRVVDWALAGLAETLIRRGEYAEALEELEQALVLNKSCVMAIDLMADCYLAMGRPREVYEKLAKAAALSPNSIERQKKLGRICVVIGYFEQAVRAFKYVLKAALDSEQDRFTASSMLLSAQIDGMNGDAGREDVRSSVQISELFKSLESVELDEEYSLMLEMLRARFLVKQGRAPQAVKLYDKMNTACIENAGDSSNRMRLELAKTQMLLGEPDRANEQLAILLEDESIGALEELEAGAIRNLEDLDPVIHRARGLNDEGAELYENDEIECSIEKFSEALALAPKSVVYNLNLSQALLRSLEETGMDNARKQMSETCLDSVSSLDEQSRHFPRYQSLRKKLDSIVSHELRT